MLSEEREKEIRKYCQFCCDEDEHCYCEGKCPVVLELLAEIDLLRAENRFMKAQRDGAVHEHDALKAEIDRLRAEYKELRHLFDELNAAELKVSKENQRLKTENEMFQKLHIEAVNLKSRRQEELHKMDKERDTLKAENETLRAQIKRLRPCKGCPTLDCTCFSELEEQLLKQTEEIRKENERLKERIEKLRACLNRYKHRIPMNRMITNDTSEFEKQYGLGRDAQDTLAEDDETAK